MLREVRNRRERQILHDITYTWNKQRNKKNPHTENRLAVARGNHGKMGDHGQ